jgi:hypothetical protein
MAVQPPKASIFGAVQATPYAEINRLLDRLLSQIRQILPEQ